MTAETTAFNPSEHLRTIKTRQGNMPYLNAKGRILWLRHEHPDASIVTEQVDGGLVHEMVAFKATISYEVDGRAVMATGHGSETVKDFPDYYEKAETKAIARACAVLGYGTEGATDFDSGEPLDGRGAAKDERAARNMEPNERQRVDQQHERHVTPEPSRLPATRRPMAPTDTQQTPADAPVSVAADDLLRDELRDLGTRGFDLGRFLTGRNKKIDDLSRVELEGILPTAREVVRKREWGSWKLTETLVE